jgi:hypothetical protein
MNKDGIINNLAERIPDILLYDGEGNLVEITNSRVINMPDSDKLLPFIELTLKDCKSGDISFLILKVL